MTGRARIAAFAATLVAVFAAAALLGSAIDPSGSSAEAEGAAAGTHGGTEVAAVEHDPTPAADDPHGGTEDATPPGLQVAEDDYRLLLDRNRLSIGDPQAQLDFQVVDGSGRPLRDLEVDHERRMHFIVVRRDLTGFQHLHPSMGVDSTWSATVDFSRGGVYRAFADFTHGGVKRTLGADVHVGGAYRPEPLPPVQTTADAGDGLSVTLESDGAPAGESRLQFEVSRGGENVNDDLQPYLGAKGHLVALREGDLAYLHTHPDGDQLAFETEYPSQGSYRLFVQFRYRGEVRTATFTQRVLR